MVDSKIFFGLIEDYISGDEADRARIDSEINDTFGVYRAVIALDMSGFTRTVRAHGIVHYLAMIYRMQRISARVMEETGGAVFKFEADNLSGTFETTEAAIEGAIAILEAIDEDNQSVDATRKIRASVGIAFSQILWIPGYDAKGDAVNIAHKLGEDLAAPGEILIEASSIDTLPTGLKYEVDVVKFETSGVSVEAHRIKFN